MPDQRPRQHPDRGNEIRTWSVERAHRKPTLTAHRAGTPDSNPHGTVINKTHTRLCLSNGKNT